MKKGNQQHEKFLIFNANLVWPVSLFRLYSITIVDGELPEQQILCWLNLQAMFANELQQMDTPALADK